MGPSVCPPVHGLQAHKALAHGKFLHKVLLWWVPGMDGRVRYQINCTHLCFYFQDHIHRIPYPDLPHPVQPTVATAMEQCWRMAAEAQASISHLCYPQEGVWRLGCNVSLINGGFGAKSLVNASDLPLGESLSLGTDGSSFLNWFVDTSGRLLHSSGWLECLAQRIDN